MNWLKEKFSKIKDALFKTKESSGLNIEPSSEDNLIEIDEEFFETLSEKLIKADIGFDFSTEIVEELKRKNLDKKVTKEILNSSLKEIIKLKINLGNKENFNLNIENERLNIILIVGVNGSGKTTSIGKLANFLKPNYKVLIAAGDTFRAAASNQLSVWAQRAEVELFSPQDIKKPDAVVYSAIEKAKKENFNVLIIDTAGRLHSQKNLMDELKKIDLVVEKSGQGLNIEKLIVLDATIGQNAISQAEQFSEIIKLSGIILAKLDSSAKGGVILNIMNKLSIPVKLIGTGEKTDDLSPFDFDEYLNGLIS